MIKRLILLSGIAFLFSMLASGECMAEEENAYGEEEHRHRIELFLGNTHEEGANNFTIAFNYEYRINQYFGVGGHAGNVRGEEREWVFLAPFYIHPYQGWRFVLAPGLDVERKTSDKEFLLRVGAAYEFEIGRWSITPEFNLDFVDQREVPVFGVSFGYAF